MAQSVLYIQSIILSGYRLGISDVARTKTKILVFLSGSIIELSLNGPSEWL